MHPALKRLVDLGSRVATHREKGKTWVNLARIECTTVNRARRAYNSHLFEEAERAKNKWSYPLSTRVLNILYTKNINSLEELKVAFLNGSLFKERNFGKQSNKEIARHLGFPSPEPYKNKCPLCFCNLSPKQYWDYNRHHKYTQNENNQTRKV